ncbi:hypothetical protein K4A87_10970 [Xanthomonas fragariae]|uniref:hypothetical protein n=1 Tax=Xanthomonas fragariae TaxID=48664 RepID=UPI001ABDF4A4|nr:hypothetical protein [Xanthomonas fragariae]UKR51380.1 hypothetical protein K4A87_10970 [Xanthomonas fragariae]
MAPPGRFCTSTRNGFLAINSNVASVFSSPDNDTHLGRALDEGTARVVLDGGAPSFAKAPHNAGPPTNPANTKIVFNGGPVSLASLLGASDSNQVHSSGHPGTDSPLDCSGAFASFGAAVLNSPF